MSQTEAIQREVVFDERGETVEEIEAAPEASEPEAVTEPEGTEPEITSETAKYRIGDKTFDTQAAALKYAQSQVSALETEQQIADAYRLGMREALQQTPQQTENVTQAQPQVAQLDTEELYTNPQAFLDKFATRIKTETRSELDKRDGLKAQSDQIWREFTERHPSLADFRTEVENFVAGSVTDVRAIISTKGKPASYDWIATKIKSRFEAYANAVKPKRELPNGGAGASPSSRAAGVTPKPDAKKPLSFSEQLRSIRKKQR